MNLSWQRQMAAVDGDERGAIRERTIKANTEEKGEEEEGGGE